MTQLCQGVRDFQEDYFPHLTPKENRILSKAITGYAKKEDCWGEVCRIIHLIGNAIKRFFCCSSDWQKAVSLLKSKILEVLRGLPEETDRKFTELFGPMGKESYSIEHAKGYLEQCILWQEGEGEPYNPYPRRDETLILGLDEEIPEHDSSWIVISETRQEDAVFREVVLRSLIDTYMLDEIVDRTGIEYRKFLQSASQKPPESK